MQIFTAIFIK